MTLDAANSINLSGHAAIQFGPHPSSPCGPIMPSYMTEECREGRRSMCFKGLDAGLGSLAAEYTIRAP
jgi:hypothetical protein